MDCNDHALKDLVVSLQVKGLEIGNRPFFSIRDRRSSKITQFEQPVTYAYSKYDIHYTKHPMHEVLRDALLLL